MDMKEKDMLKEYKKMLKKELFMELGKDIKTCACDYNKHKMIASIITTMCDIDKMMGKSKENGYEGEEYSTAKEKHELTHEMAMAWTDGMKNSDGTIGAHWTIDQTTSVAESNGVMFDHITPEDWYVVMNMMYSDYGVTLANAGADDVSVYAQLSKNFLFDKDALPPQEKLCYYYKYIVKK